MAQDRGQELSQDPAQVLGEVLGQELAKDRGQELSQDPAQVLRDVLGEEPAQDMGQELAQDRGGGLGEGFAQEMGKGLGEASLLRGCHFQAVANSEFRTQNLQERATRRG